MACQGVYCSLRQLLEEGFFHADPHPGNLVATSDGYLAYFDFGMMGDIPRHYRVGLIRVVNSIPSFYHDYEPSMRSRKIAIMTSNIFVNFTFSLPLNFMVIWHQNIRCLP